MISKRKIYISSFILLLIIFSSSIYFLSQGKVYEPAELTYGVTFSKNQAENLGLDWKKLYLEIMENLGVKKIRLSAYWDEIEKDKGNINWDNLDWQILEAKKRNVQVILAVGARLPRWPECHYPEWAKKLDGKDLESALLDYIEKTVNRYLAQENIVAWQVENEPFLRYFGECPEPNIDLLDKEISLVKKLESKKKSLSVNIDYNRPIIVTDSGELSIWIPAASRADIFGTTMYRDTYSKQLKRYIHYPIGPKFFQIKKNLTNLFVHPKDWIVIELQAEPWGPKPFQELTKEERDRTMNREKFKEIIEFARLAGFKEFYLWGVEWWAWEKEKNNDSGLWDEAKVLFK